MKQLLIFFTAIALSWIAQVRTDGFSPEIIAGPLLSRPAAEMSDHVREALCQPYHYLGKGRQSFVFASSDDRFVLKFFNQKYLKMPWYSFLVEEKERKKRGKRRHFYENSYEIALKEFNEKILYLNMSLNADLPAILIRDKASRAFQIDLSRTPFVLQRRGKPFYPTLKKIFKEEGLKGLYRELDRFKEQVEVRISKQIADGDSDVEHNWGYIDGQIFHLDPGRLYFDPNLNDPKRQQEEWDRTTLAETGVIDRKSVV